MTARRLVLALGIVAWVVVVVRLAALSGLREVLHGLLQAVSAPVWLIT